MLGGDALPIGLFRIEQRSRVRLMHNTLIVPIEYDYAKDAPTLEHSPGMLCAVSAF
jgi:hypothetical protein